MAAVELSVSEWLTIITHVKKWVTNLLRAKSERKRQSKDALRAVIKAVRENTIYLRILREGRQKSIARERKLSLLWTELSFRLEDLGLEKLANRCSIMGRYWADPAVFTQDFLDTADTRRLSDIEKLAYASLKVLKK
ncbi:MAG: hypothetical protein OEY18_08090 [Candidatus Aminicenantes bacterium]|jgi:hypothetical protein|nr:hypothetical protein [Candidatus Aminicenantes bacterium]